MIRIEAEMRPVPYKRVRFNGKKAYNDAKYTEFKNGLGYFALKAMRGLEPLKGAIKLSMIVQQQYEPEKLKAGDIDNHLKATADALNGICYEDDRQIVDAHIILRQGTPRIEIELEEIK